MKRREFLAVSIAAAGALTLSKQIGFAEEAKPAATAIALPPLPYAYEALEPHIDARTMRFHHDKHHAAYVNNLNKALASYPDLQTKSVVDMVKDLGAVPDAIRTTVRNNGGGHLNHTMFWEIMGPKGGGTPKGKLAKAIQDSFGTFDAFKEAFQKAGGSVFGSGWVWLVLNGDKLQVTSTPNQDSPFMQNQYPIMGNDVWEHAYYLNYQNRRADYLKAWWNVVNWDEVNRRYEKALS